MIPGRIGWNSCFTLLLLSFFKRDRWFDVLADLFLVVWNTPDIWSAICFKIMTRYTCGFLPRILAIIPATRYTCVFLSRILAFYSQVYDHFLSLRSMAVLSSPAQERRSRGPRNSRAKCVFQVTPAPISLWFLCPRPPLLLTAPNQNRHDTQARFHLACCAGVFFRRANFFARKNAMLLCLLSLIFLRHKIKDGGYNNTNINKKLSPAQNAPALQARFHSARFTYYLSRLL